MTERAKDQPFDERAALGELERFRAEIEQYRRQRQAVHQEFEQFVSSLPAPESVFPPEEPTSPARSGSTEPSPFSTPLPPVPPRPAPASRPTSGPQRSPASATAPRADVPADEPSSRAAATRPAAGAAGLEAALTSLAGGRPAAPTPSPARSRIVVLLLLLVLAIAAGLWIWTTRSAEFRQTAAPAAAPAQPPTTSAAPAAEGTPVTPPTTESVLTTVRPAWVRVIADGERVVERELPAGARVTFNAAETIVVRSGDAGAVRLSIRGEDQGPLGKDGAVLTRSFTVPEKAPR